MISVSIFGFLCLRTQTVDWETVDMGSLYPTQIPKVGALRSSHVWLTRSGFYFLPSEGRFPMFPGCPASCRLSSWLLLDLVLWTVLSVPRVAWEARAGGFAPTFTSLAMGWIPQWRCLPLRWWWSHLDWKTKIPTFNYLLRDALRSDRSQNRHWQVNDFQVLSEAWCW